MVVGGTGLRSCPQTCYHQIAGDEGTSHLLAWAKGNRWKIMNTDNFCMYNMRSRGSSPVPLSLSQMHPIDMACRTEGIIPPQPQTSLPRGSLAVMDLITVFTLCHTIPWLLATCPPGQRRDLPLPAIKPTIPGLSSCFKAITMSSTGFLNKPQPSLQGSLAPLL